MQNRSFLNLLILREPRIKSLAVALGFAGWQARRGECGVVTPHKRLATTPVARHPSPPGWAEKGPLAALHRSPREFTFGFAAAPCDRPLQGPSRAAMDLIKGSFV